MDRYVRLKITDTVVTKCSIRHSSRLPMLVVSVFLMGVMASYTSADTKQGKPIRPTFVRDAMVEVPRAGSVEITLEAIPSYGNQEAFEIQSLPEHGTISGIKNLTDHTASVIYRHDGSRIPLQDGFLFRAKAPGQTTSTPGKVSIRMIPTPARLIFEPGVLDFGAVMLSDKKRTNLTLKNIGGSRAIGRVVFPDGFVLTEGAEYNLDEGECVSMTVVFSPAEMRDYVANASLIPNGIGEPLRLRGCGQPRYQVNDHGGGNWMIRNLSTNSILISFSPIGNIGAWMLPPDTMIPPQSEKPFILQQTESGENTNKVSLPSGVRITDGLTESRLNLPAPRRFIPLTVQRVAPLFTVKLPLGGAEELSFTLLNRSDAPKRAFWKITSPLGGGMSHPSAVELRSGELKEIHYTWTPAIPGEAAANLIVEEGVKMRHELNWKAEVTNGPVASPTLQFPSDQETARTGTDGHEGTASLPTSHLPEAPLPAVEGAAVEVTVPLFGKPKVSLRWSSKPGRPSASVMHIEESVLAPVEGASRGADSSPEAPFRGMAVRLVNVTSTPLKPERESEGVCISNLPSGYHLIVLSRRTLEGKPVAQSLVQVFLPARHTWWSVVKVPCGIIAIIFLILFLGKLRRAA